MFRHWDVLAFLWSEYFQRKFAWRRGQLFDMARNPNWLIFTDGNLTARSYVDNLLAPYVILHFSENPFLIFMHDNARPHSARGSQQFLDEHNVEVLSWSPISPHLNPFEHVWDKLGKWIRRRSTTPSDLNDFRCPSWGMGNYPSNNHQHINYIDATENRRCQRSDRWTHKILSCRLNHFSIFEFIFRKAINVLQKFTFEV